MQKKLPGLPRAQEDREDLNEADDIDEEYGDDKDGDNHVSTQSLVPDWLDTDFLNGVNGHILCLHR